MTNTNDSGQGSLRQAIIDAAPGDTINFNIPTSDPGYDAVSGQYTVSLTSGELLIDKNLTVNGPGANQMIVRRSADAGTPDFRIINVTSTGTVNISGLTISHGVSPGNVLTGGGGGIKNARGTLNLIGAVVSTNSTTGGGRGGGIANYGGIMSLINSTVSDNQTSERGDGGGIYNGPPTAFDTCDADTLNVINTTISGNFAADAPRTSNGVSNQGGEGGGIFSYCALNVINSTISDNRTGRGAAMMGGRGGGIASFAGTANLRNTIISGNSVYTGGPASENGEGPDLSGTFNSQDYNLIKSTETATFTGTITHNITGQDAKLRPLSDNGGTTPTMLPLGDSPAINAGDVTSLPEDTFDLDSDGNSSEVLPFDQRGGARAVGTGLDMGAVETNYTITTIAGTPQSTEVNTAFATQLQAVVKESGTVQSGQSVTFTAPSSGAGCTFQGGVTTTSPTTDSNGLVTSGALSANSVAGSYSVVGSLGNNSQTATFTLTNSNLPNTPPTDISLSNSSVVENRPGDTIVGTFSTVDSIGSTFTYALVAGVGSTDNSSFTIAGNTLQTTAAFDFETQSTYSIRVRSTDPEGAFFEKQFVITVTDLPDSWGALSFSSPTFRVAEGDGNATITLKRTGGSDGTVYAKVSLADVTTSPADYIFSPGSVDTSFLPSKQVGSGSALSYGYPTMALQPDGKILVADGTIWRFNTDGSTDTAFGVGNTFNGGVSTVALQPDGKIIIAGSFTTINNQRFNRMARLNSDGSLDPTFNVGTGPNASVSVMVVQPDGKILVSGYFDTFNGVHTGYEQVIRLNSDGSLDSSFSYFYGLASLAMALQPDGKLVQGGWGGVRRLNTDGTIDNTFNAQFTGSSPIVENVALQPDGRVVIVGSFDHVAGQVAYGVARLNADGSLDSTFNTGTGPDATPIGLALQPDGKILIGGNFKTFNGTPVTGIARLNNDGSLDPTFVSGLAPKFSDTYAYNILLQPDGKIFVRGQFTTPGANPYFARLRNDLFATWKDGDTADKTVTLPIVNDLLDELDETLTLSLTTIGGATTATPSTATLTIVDNDVSLSSISGAGTYGGTGTFTATLTKNGVGLSGKTISFSRHGVPVGEAITDANGVATLTNVSFSNLTAGTFTNATTASFAGDSAYPGRSGTGTLTVNKAAQTITFGPLADKTAADGILSVNATASSGYSPSYAASGQCTKTGSNIFRLTNVGTCTITVTQDGDVNYSAATPVSQTFNITKATKPPTVTSSVNPSDFGQSVTFTATIPSGGATPTGLIQFKIDGNAAGNPATLNANGAASFTISNLSAGTHTVTADYSGDGNFNASTNTLTGGQVVKNPPAISISDVSITEGNTGTRSASFNVTLSTSSSLSVSFDYATADGTATAGSDYQSASGTLTFSPFQTFKTLTVIINGDTRDEPNETFFLNLSHPQNGTLAKTQATATILNDDAPGVRFTANSYTFSEGAGHGDITLTRTGDLSSAISIDYTTFDQSALIPCQNNGSGGASDRCDYVTASGTLRFAAGEQTKAIPLTLVDDAYLENAETLSIRLSNPQGASISSVDTATITITDNDTQAATQNPIDNQAFFIRQQYLDFLGREPEQAGFDFWNNRMNNCPQGQTCDRIDTSQRFFQADEFQERGFYVYRLYDAVLGRLPKYVEFVSDVARLNGPQTPAEQRLGKDAYLLSFMNKQEFRNLYGAYVSADGLTAVDAAGFVNALCAKSGITPINKQTLIDNLQNRMKDPAHTLEDFILTAEMSSVGTLYYDRGFITMQYFGYLRRDPEQAGFDFWVGQLIGPNAPHRGDYRFMVGGFLQSDEYCFRFALLSHTP